MRWATWSALQLLPLHPRLAMDAHPDLHLIFPDGEGRPAGLRDGNRGERHAHRASIVQRLFRDRRHFVQRSALLGFCPCNLKSENHPSHTTAAPSLFGRGGGDIVLDQHGADFDIFHRRHLGSHIEIHYVAAVVAVYVNHALAPVDAPGHFKHLVCAGRLEYIADRTAVQHPLSHVAEEDRQVPGAAAGCQADLALDGRFCSHNGVDILCVCQRIDEFEQAVEHLRRNLLAG
jgi:hypothetical protein